MNPRSAARRSALLALGLVATSLEALTVAMIDESHTSAAEKASSAEAVALDPMTIEASREADEVAAADSAQRSAPNVISVVATTEFGPLVDSNPGEFLKYLPGIDIEPVAPGYSRFGLRGLGPDNTEFLFDGLPLANMHADRDTDRTTRRFDMSLISGADIARTEVRKLPLPSDSANSLGGTINLVRRSAFDTPRRHITYQVALRGDSQEFSTDPLAVPGGQAINRWRPNWQVVWTEPIHRDLGFSLALGQDDQLLRTQLSTTGWSIGTADSAAKEAVNLSHPALTRASLLAAPQHQKKSYALARLDWRPRPELVINAHLGVHDSRQDDRYTNPSWSVAPTSVISPVRSHGATHTHGQPLTAAVVQGSGLWREAATVTTVAHLAAHWTRDAWAWGAKAGWSRSTSRVSDTDDGTFGGTSVGTAPGLVAFPSTGVGLGTANPIPLMLDFQLGAWGLDDVKAWTLPAGVVPEGAIAADYTVPVDWRSNDVARIGGARSRPGEAQEVVTSAKIFAKRNFEFSLPTSMQLGWDWVDRSRDREYEYHAWRFVGADGIPGSSDDSASLISGGPARREPPFRLPEPESISPPRLHGLFREHPSWFRYDDARSEYLTLTLHPAYDLQETISAPYLEFETRIDRRLRLTGGVRYEHIDATARGLLVDPNAAYMRYADGSIVRSRDTHPDSVRPDGLLVVRSGTSAAPRFELTNDPTLLPAVRAGLPVFTPEIQAAGLAALAAGEVPQRAAPTSIGRGTLAHTRAVYRPMEKTNTTSGDGWFPSLHATYDLSEGLTLQAGYARTQGRIDYTTALIPTNQVSSEPITQGVAAGAIGQITLHDATLEPWTADNVEVRLTWRLGRSLVALSGFSKHLRNFQPETTTPPLSVDELTALADRFPEAGLGPEYEGYSVRYLDNAGTARLDGAEIEFRAPLDALLPEWTRGFDLTGNATWLHHEGVHSEELGLNRTWMGSANLRYTAGRLAIRAGYRYNGEQIVNPQVETGGWTGRRIRLPQHLLDVAIDYTIARQARVFIAVTNLTNELTVDETHFPGKPAYANLAASRTIAATWTFGIAGTF